MASTALHPAAPPFPAMDLDADAENDDELVVAGSDDEERWLELAEEQETSYWSMVDEGSTSEYGRSSSVAAAESEAGDVEEGGKEQPQYGHATTPPSTLQLEEPDSPDPMDLLSGPATQPPPVGEELDAVVEETPLDNVKPREEPTLMDSASASPISARTSEDIDSVQVSTVNEEARANASEALSLAFHASQSPRMTSRLRAISPASSDLPSLSQTLQSDARPSTNMSTPTVATEDLSDLSSLSSNEGDGKVVVTTVQARVVNRKKRVQEKKDKRKRKLLADGAEQMETAQGMREAVEPLSAPLQESIVDEPPVASTSTYVFDLPSPTSSEKALQEKQKQPTPPRRRTSLSPSVPAEEPINEYIVGGRAMRKRTAVQTNPYSIEFARFAKNALKNSWQGIITTAGLGVNRREQEQYEEEKRRKKLRELEANGKRVNTLGGWLEVEDEEGNTIRVRGDADERTRQASREDSDMDEDFVYRSPERKERRRDLGSPEIRRSSSKGKERAILDEDDNSDDSLPDIRAGPYRYADPAEKGKGRKSCTAKGSREPGSHRREGSPRTLSARDGTSHRSSDTKRRQRRPDSGHASSSGRKKARTESAPPSSQPDVPPETSRSRAQSSSPVRAAGAPVAYRRKKKRRKLAGIVGDDQAANLNPSQSNASEEDEEEEALEDGEDDSDVELVDPESSPGAADRFVLDKKRKKALKGMMPAIFFKTAQQDLEKMREEKRAGRVVREYGSGDEEEEAVEARTSRARTRINPRNADRPFMFRGEQSTSDSSDDGGATSVFSISDNEEENQHEAFAMASWADPHLARSARAAPTGNRGAAKKSFESVIDSILMRRTLEKSKTGSGTRRRRRAQGERHTSRSGARNGAGDVAARSHKSTPASEKSGERRKQGKSKQSRVDQYYLPPVYLDDEDALFGTGDGSHDRIVQQKPTTRPEINPFRMSAGDASRQKERHDADTMLGIPPRAVPQDLAQHRQPAVVEEDAWSKFSGFSFDFNIKRLPPGISFSSSSYIGKGHLHELVQLHGSIRPAEQGEDVNRKKSCAPFGIQLDSDMGAEAFISLLPRFCDSIYAEYAVEDKPTSLLSPAGEALRFFIHYMQDCLSADHVGRECLATTQATLLDLESRLAEYASDGGPSRTYVMLSYRWYMLELAYRSYHSGLQDNTSEDTAREVLTRFGELVQNLLEARIDHAMRAVRKIIAAGEVDARLEDLSCELWVCVLQLCHQDAARVDGSLLSYDVLWQLLDNHLRDDSRRRSLHPIPAGEKAAYTAVSLSALSQFSLHGLSTSTPRIASYWPIFLSAIDQIQPEQLRKGESTLSSTALKRQNCYIWTLLARCLVLANRWRWPLLYQSKMVGKLFAILNVRELRDMSMDGDPAFPSFVRTFNGKIDIELDQHDTAFHIFLRILAVAAGEAAQLGTDKAKNTLGSMLMRAMPMRERLPYPRSSSSSVSTKDRSILVNHYSLLIVLAICIPSSADRIFARFKNMLDFTTSSRAARQDCLRAILYLGVVYASKGFNLSPILQWLAEISDYLRSEYARCAKQRLLISQPLRDRTNQQHAGNNHAKSKQQQSASFAQERQREMAQINAEMYEVAEMTGSVLGVVRHMMASSANLEANKAEKSYPSLDFLNPAWIKHILDSSMALDPLVSLELNRCIQCFLSCRLDSMPKPKAPGTNGESQDEFGSFDDFDYDDPALNQMLGIEGDATAKVSEGQDKGAQDLLFSEIIKQDISPAIYRHLSIITAPNLGRDTGVPVIADRDRYLGELVQTWTGCAAVLVHNNQRDWTFYLGPFGKESWQRMSDPITRWEIGTHFAYCLLKLDGDGKAYKDHREHLLETVLRALVAPTLSINAHRLVNALLNADSRLLLWRNLPGALQTGLGVYDVTEDELKSQRLALMREAIFRNAKCIIFRMTSPPDIATTECAEEPFTILLTKQMLDAPLVYRLFGHMLSSMRDHLDALSGKGNEGGSRLGWYTSRICKEVLSALKEELGPLAAIERNIPNLRLLAGVMQD